MKVFREFLLDTKNIAEQTVYMPFDSEPIGVVKSNDTTKLLALVPYTGQDLSASELRTFKICASDEILYTDAVKYIGSYESRLGLRHVIEIKKEY